MTSGDDDVNQPLRIRRASRIKPRGDYQPAYFSFVVSLSHHPSPSHEARTRHHYRPRRRLPRRHARKSIRQRRQGLGPFDMEFGRRQGVVAGAQDRVAQGKLEQRGRPEARAGELGWRREEGRKGSGSGAGVL